MWYFFHHRNDTNFPGLADKYLKIMLGKFIRQFWKEWSGTKNLHAAKDRYNMRDKKKGIRTRERFALIYAFAAWTCFGFTFYSLVKNRMPNDPAEKRASIHNLAGAPGNLYVCKIEGLTVVDEFQMKFEEEDEDEDEDEDQDEEEEKEDKK